MHLEILVEEPSAEAALENLLPKLLPADITFRLLNLQSKPTLLTELPKRLKGYKSWLPSDGRLVVLVDEDRQACDELKAQLERAAAQAGLITKTAAPEQKRFQVLNRIIIEELEARFFGDVEALVAAYPRIPATLGKKEKYRDPDAIKGGTWEALERILQKHGHHLGGLPKIEVARRISKHMLPERNCSRSFNVFMSGLKTLIES